MIKINYGFTLIEVMIVTVIISIIASISFAEYSNYIMKAQSYEVYNAELIVKKAMENNIGSNGLYNSLSGSCPISNDAIPNDFCELTFITNFNCETFDSSQSYSCTLSSNNNKGVNQKLIGSSYEFNSLGARRTLSTGDTGWLANDNCYVTSKSGC